MLPRAWLTPASPGRAGDSQMSLPRAFAKSWLPGIAICFARIYGLPWKSGPGSGEQCDAGLCPLAGVPPAIRSVGEPGSDPAGFAYTTDATQPFVHDAVVPCSIYIVVPICDSDHLSSLTPLAASPRTTR